jgi:hypothetical protein
MAPPGKKPPRTLETPMMPANMRPPPAPEAQVVIAQPEAKHYVHEGARRSTGLVVLLSISGVLVVVALVVGVLVATGHLAIR